MPDYRLESAQGAKNGKIVIGLDEAGRGPLAGPVVAAAVWLPPDKVTKRRFKGLDDSKKLTATAREELYGLIMEEAEAAVGMCSVEEIDRINILRASLLAMTRAAEQLEAKAEMALVDGNKAPPLPCPSETVIKGDGKCLSIAAASIIAKVTRDRIMAGLAEVHPLYGWERNQGYGTAEHCAAIKAHGVTDEHRRSFRPVHEALQLSL